VGEANEDSGDVTGSVTYRELFRGQPGRLAVGLLLLEFVAAVQVYVTATVLPLVSEELNGQRYYGLALSASTVALFVSTPLAAPIARRLGSRKVLLGSGVLYMAGTLLSAAATSMPVFAAGRIVQGLGGGAMFALGYAIVAEEFPSRMRARLIALLTSMWLLPSLLGPTGAALLATSVGWRWTLLTMLPPMIAAVALVAGRVSGQPPPGEPEQATPLAATAVMTVGAAAVSFGGSRSGLLALVLLVAGLILVLGGASRVLPEGTATGSSPTAAAVAGLLLALFAFFGGDGLITLYVTAGLGDSIGWAAAALSAGGIAWSFSTLAQPRLLDRSGQRGLGIVLAGSVMITVSLAGLFVLLLLVSSDPAKVAAALVIVAWAAGGAGMGLVYPTLTLGALLVPTAAAGRAATSVVLTEALGGTLSLAIGGSLVSLSATQTGNYRTGLLMSYGLFAVISAAVPFYARRAPARVA
jgi:MFS family permease